VTARGRFKGHRFLRHLCSLSVQHFIPKIYSKDSFHNGVARGGHPITDTTKLKGIAATIRKHHVSFQGIVIEITTGSTH
jgi:hypothetical protein